MANATETTTETRERIVAAAGGLFYARGFNAVGMDEVRTAAGVSLKRLYAEFPGKEQLVLEVLAARRRRWEDGLARTAAGLDDPRQRLLAVFDFLEEWFREDTFRGCGFINAFGELGATSPAVAAAAREQKRAFQDHLARLAVESGADESLGAQLALLAEGAQTTAAIAGCADAVGQARGAAEVLVDAALGRR
ncbi:TetR/AcrR family transcriptional regulator [Cellulomonas fengjieae]|uniref:Helix-turn-helix transcriptional regulator n=1 Tax=Cellulomonas fengjieae TaxID=2819978 RepID=A0ABS3SKP2_9CELL|nr:TetR/AcrR family transcriptional regulator [Cellulomonas fengjieae]MBO3086305.1 helix-turn-helix transcriptional regulator [Cellulomonas fengjieae]MBO3102292.1 helix-turn-helix transcriptional regulator [Cellulomonas fengjieae]QVI65656.1 helix-turn-helix transcriptional regulator [Cellulomonas fengjieae]